MDKIQEQSILADIMLIRELTEIQINKATILQ